MLHRFFVVLLCLASALTLNAQTTPTPVGLAEAEERLANLATDESPESKAIRRAWEDVLAALKGASESQLQAEHLLQELKNAPAELASLNSQLATAAPAEPPPPFNAGRAALETRVSALDAQLETANAALAAIDEKEARHFARQSEIPTEIAGLRTALADPDIELTKRPLVTASALEQAEYQRNLARRAALEARSSELEAEQKSHSAIGDLIAARKRLAAREVERLTTAHTSWELRLTAVRKAEASTSRRTTESLALRVQHIPELAVIAEQTAKIAVLRTALADAIAKTDVSHATLLEQLRTIREQRKAVQRRIQLLESAKLRIDAETGSLLRLQRSKLPTLDTLTGTLERDIRAATKAQIQQLQLKGELATLPVDINEQIETIASKNLRKNFAIKDARPLLEQRRSSLEAAIDNLATYIESLSASNLTTRDAIDEVRSYSLYIDKRLLWIPSAPILKAGDFTVEAQSIRHLFSKAVFGAWFSHTIKDIRQHPLAWFLFIALLAHLFLRRRHYITAITSIGANASRRTCTSILPTFKALWFTTLTALPLPLLFGFLALRANNPSEIGIAFRDCAFFFTTFGFFKALCRPHGIFQDHFRLAEDRLAHIRKHLRWLFIGFPVLLFIATSLQVNALFPQSGRLIFLLLLAEAIIFFHLLLKPSKRLIQQKNGETWLAKSLCFLGYAIPASFIAGIAMGYITSVRTLRIQIIATIWIILAGLFIAAILTRWILVSRRRLARDQAIQKFKATEAESNSKDKNSKTTPPSRSLAEVEACAANVVVVEEQTTRLLRVGTLVVLAIAVWNVWATSLPALSALDNITIWPLSELSATQSASTQLADFTSTLTGSPPAPAPASSETTNPIAASTTTSDSAIRISLLDLLGSLSTILLTVIAARNIPGLLELTLLRRLTLGPGGNYAVSTVLRYIIVVFGFLIAFGLIGITWRSVQWLAAAVTLGIGFGLQEIFANFVAGIILLFERPIRLGDVVTVGNISGVVSKIEIRATTIKQFNNRELVVPNKEFITGQLVNWTLSDNCQRFDFVVGVAYGSDTELAETILKETLSNHPKIQKSPAPDVLFTAFGASTLDFQIRGFVPEVGLLLTVQSELHFEIDKRFREAGIEIAFPQQDIHIRSIPEEWKQPLSPQAPQS